MFYTLSEKNCTIWARFKLSSANAFSFDEAKHLLFGKELTHSLTMTPFDIPGKQAFWKHCGKRRNCSWAIFPFPTVFSTCLDYFLPFSSNLKLSSANSFSLEESKICHLVLVLTKSEPYNLHIQTITTRVNLCSPSMLIWAKTFLLFVNFQHVQKHSTSQYGQLFEKIEFLWIYNNVITYTIWYDLIRDILTLSQTSPGFYTSAVQVFWKHCGKKEKLLFFP